MRDSELQSSVPYPGCVLAQSVSLFQPGNMSEKKTRVTLSISDKIKILDRLKKGKKKEKHYERV